MSQTPIVEKLSIGIPGFDEISYGGLPKNRITLVSGTVASGKTVFAAQFLVDGILHADQNAVYVTFEESPAEIRKNCAAFGWDISAWEAEGKWIFVDASPVLEITETTGQYSLDALIARIKHAISQVNAKRISIDSLAALLAQINDPFLVRREVFRIMSELRQKDITGVITSERAEQLSDEMHYSMEEFVADNVIILRNISEVETRRRTIEILKFRGADHQKREFPFAIIPNEGVVIIPLVYTHLTQKVSSTRITTGNEKFDAMFGGGVFSDSHVLVSGPSGVGKSVIASQFLNTKSAKEQRSILFAFEESRDLLVRNAEALGFGFEALEKSGQLKVIARYPEEASIEDHLVLIKNAINEFKPSRIVLDSMSAFNRISSHRSFTTFAVGLTSFLKDKGIAALFTHTAETLFGAGTSIEETRSTLADIIVMLRFAEVRGEILRVVTVLKMRGSNHDKNIRTFTIDSKGLRIGEPYREVTGILTGMYLPTEKAA